MKLKWVEIPAGIFQMGGIPEDKFVSAVELPQHEVVIENAFALGVIPVTRGEWFGTPVADADLPIISISFDEIQGWLARQASASGIPYRLPSEAEWEYACRAGSNTVFPNGSNLEPAQANYFYNESGEAVGRGALTPCGIYPPNAFGLYDMLGNVCEWTADAWHPDFHQAPTDGSPRLDSEKTNRRVIRGGAWDHLPRVLRASWRDWAPETARWDNLGFRIAFTL